MTFWATSIFGRKSSIAGASSSTLSSVSSTYKPSWWTSAFCRRSISSDDGRLLMRSVTLQRLTKIGLTKRPHPPWTPWLLNLSHSQRKRWLQIRILRSSIDHDPVPVEIRPPQGGPYRRASYWSCRRRRRKLNMWGGKAGVFHTLAISNSEEDRSSYTHDIILVPFLDARSSHSRRKQYGKTSME